MEKRYLHMEAEFHPDGSLRPVRFLWDEDQWVDIERTLCVRLTNSLKENGKGVFYDCRAQGRPIRLFREGDRWFVEAC